MGCFVATFSQQKQMKRSRIASSSLLHPRKVTKVGDSTDVTTGIKKTVSVVSSAPKRKGFTPPTKTKVTAIASTAAKPGEKIPEEVNVYEVFWTKRSNKKHKNYADGMPQEIQNIELSKLTKHN